MKVGLIAEFNPFHNGHKYLINKIKEQFPNCYLVIALSGNYTQRGELSVLPFAIRKNLALEHGANEVVEIDLLTSIQAAHQFAKGSIDLLVTKGINVLAFGVDDEIADISNYINCAMLTINNKEYDQKLKKYLSKGFSYPYSAFQSLKDIIESNKLSYPLPKDILGFEYVKYILKNKLDIIPVCFKRTAAHNDDNNANNIYASGSYIRKLLLAGKDVSKFTPARFPNKIPNIADEYYKFQQIVFSSSTEELKSIYLMDEGMENLFKKNISCSNYNEFIQACTSKRYIASRIKRVFLCVLLGIKKNDIKN